MELNMHTEELYQQIEAFNNTLTDSTDKSSKTYQEARFYVNNNEAIDKASFIGYLIKNNHLQNSYNTILDMTFGSGNLISHIVFDNNIVYEIIYLNDRNIDRTNQNINTYIDNCKILSYDILEKNISSEINANLVILNPQIGGNYIEGDLYQQRQEKEKNQDILDKLTLNINTYLESGATILFYGEDKDFKALFGEYNYIRYKSESKQLYIVKKDFEDIKCFQKIDDSFAKIDCYASAIIEDNEALDFDDLILEIDNIEYKDTQKELSFTEDKEIEKLKFSNETKGNIKFPYRNILFKGVPGTGKSETIKNIITDKLDMKELTDNVLRINIHSASSNSDLMQGISISTTKNNENVLYREKQGAILKHIFKAIYKPKQPFLLVLEEIQENSLNELIGDLIYLIEDKKRTIVDLDISDDTEIAYYKLFEKINEKAKEKDKSVDYVELPSLVENSQNNTKMIVPDNLFIFCTSNYRDDKKVIEDNLLRRFDVIEIYPKYDGIYKSEDIPKFLEKLNNQILEQFKDEIHPDRYLIGHANWLDIEEDSENSQIAFYKALLKVIIEFKEIREIDFDSELKPILEKVFKDIKLISDRLERYLKIFYDDDKLELKSYKHIVDLLQKEIYKSFL